MNGKNTTSYFNTCSNCLLPLRESVAHNAEIKSIRSAVLSPNQLTSVPQHRVVKAVAVDDPFLPLDYIPIQAQQCPRAGQQHHRDF